MKALKIISYAVVALFVLGTLGQNPAMAQTFSNLYTITQGTSGSIAVTTILPGLKGALYISIPGANKAKTGSVIEINAKGQEKTLYTFTGGADGGQPYGIVQDSSGNIYGDVAAGGQFGEGGVFKLTPSGVETVIYNFTGGKDGGEPAQFSPLAMDTSGNLYGIALTGGEFSNGVVFEVTPAGTERVIYSVPAKQVQPFGPWGMTRTPQGNFFATNFNLQMDFNGALFEVTASGKEKELFAFPESSLPYSNLALDNSGTLYGTLGAGSVFKFTQSGIETILYGFSNSADGLFPFGTVALDPTDNLYGTTLTGGSGCAPNGCGVVWQVSPDGIETVLHMFSGGSIDGSEPSGVVRDSAGNLYGATSFIDGEAFVFKVVP